jgi:hypothetical protein
MPPKDFFGTVESRLTYRKDGYTGRSFSYPSDSGDICMIMKFKTYSFSDSTKRASEIGGQDTMFLPLPEQLNDTSNIKVGAGELGVTGALATDAFSDLNSVDDFVRRLRSAGQTAGEEAKETVDDIKRGKFGDVAIDALGSAKYFARSTISSLFPGAGIAADVIGGNAINPHATLDFDGVDLKAYQFNWTLAPKSEKESDAIKNIIRQINFHIHPKYQEVAGGATRSLNQALLEYPSLVTASLSGGLSSDHYVKLFEYPMMVSNFQVNYSPQGNSILEGGKPAIVQMSMSLTETVIRTRQDYT